MPPAVSSSAVEAVELASMAGLEVDPWQRTVLDGALGERADGRWSAFEVGVCVSRQNGKGGILEVRELAGLYLFGERLLIHSAHQFDTSLEAFRRLLDLIEGCDDLSRRVKRVSRAHGEEGIELHGPPGRRVTGGQRIRFRTRTKGGGRGFSGDCLVLDEAMMIPEAMHGALLPTLSARPNPQVWYTGSAVDQDVHDHGVVFTRVRDRAMRGGDEALAFFEWSAEGDLDQAEAVATDPEAWALANPALGIRITAEHVAREQRSMDPRTFAVERLGIGDWPSLEDGDGVDLETWLACADPSSAIEGGVVFTFDVSPDRSWATIAAAGFRADGVPHVEVVDRRAGASWVPGRLAELEERHETLLVSCDERGPAAALLPKVRDLGVLVTTVNAREYAEACGAFTDAVNDRAIRHLGSTELKAAVTGAKKRALGDAWAWSRKSSAVDITPLVACTIALSKLAGASSVYEDRDLVVLTI